MTEISGGSLSKSFVVSQDTEPSSPFEGQIWIDSSSASKTTYIYKNGSFESIGQDLSFIETFMNDVSAQLEILDLNSSLNEWNYDDGIVEIFNQNGSNIASSSNVIISTGLPGSVQLKEFEGVLYDSGWNMGYLNQTSSGSGQGWSVDPYEGSVFGHSYGDSSSRSATNSFGPSSSTKFNLAWIVQDSVDQDVRMELRNGSTTIMRVDEGDTNPSSDSWDEIVIEVDWDNEQYTIYDNGGSNNRGTKNFQNSASEVDTLWLEQTNNSGYDRGHAFDKFGQQATSGSITLSRRTLDITPSKAVASIDGTIPTGTSLNVELSDNSGNSKTIQDSDFDTEQTIPFEDAEIQAKINYSTTNSDRPIAEKVQILGVQ